jgi:c(7)-type cytochrome triheme protein
MKISKYYILFFISLVLFLSTTAYLSKDKSYYVKKEMTVSDKKVYDNSKIIKFDHQLHIKDAGVKCEDCHTYAIESVSAKDNLNPKKKDCESCHDVKDTKQCNLCHYDNVYKKLKSSDRELVFSHKEHMKDQKCTDCHKGLDAVKFSGQGASSMPDMENCYSCHNNEKASNNCETCHSNLSNLTPVTHLKTNFLNEHTMDAGVNSKNNCMMCHSDNFCQTCHSPLNFTGNNTKDNFYAPYYTKDNGTRTDRGELQKLSTAHNLNYLYTHGLDANQKSFECNTCHNPVDFCSSCHQSGGNIITGIAPSSHQQPNFATMDASNGGGLHSQLARRDIESCQSCHDVAGQDPVCAQCHLNPNIINGKDIK